MLPFRGRGVHTPASVPWGDFHTGVLSLSFVTYRTLDVHPYTHSTIDPSPSTVQFASVHVGPQPTGSIFHNTHQNTHEPHFDQVWVFSSVNIPPNDLRSPARPLQLRVLYLCREICTFINSSLFKGFITTCQSTCDRCCCVVGLQNYVKSN